LFITSLLVLLFVFEVPLKKISKKSCSKKKKTSDNKEGALCVFSFCFCGGAL
jgi:hypothetical protein